MKRKTILVSIAVIFLISALPSVIISLKAQKKMKEMFKMNKSLQEEGYYMGDFEFKMLGLGYLVDKGHYRKAYKMLSEYHEKLKNKKNLIKYPKFNSKQEEMEFYLNLQNPKTGAFIDESVPFCTYLEITKNIIDHLNALRDSSNQPLKLKYPLKFLDEINTPEKLTKHLDDISYISWLGSIFPQTTFHFSRNLLGEAHSENTFEKANLYQFSPEWKQAMLKWMYDFQDSTTGLWGPKSRRKHKLLKYDMNNTASILKSYRDNDGNDLYAEFPLKYADKIFKSSVEQLSEKYPDDDDLDEIHEWNLRQSKGINMLLRHLWKDATAENKKNAEKIILRYINLYFEKYYIEEEGAFSYYPNAKHASCDGELGIFSDIGAFSYKKQKKLWGNPAENIKNLGEFTVNRIEPANLNSAIQFPGINSLRIYSGKPDYERQTEKVWAVYYPKDTLVLDIMELVPNIIRWSETSTLSMGNWTSMAEIETKYSKLNIKKPLIYKNTLPIDDLNKQLNEVSELNVIGFDKLQVPRCLVVFKSDKNPEK